MLAIHLAEVALPPPARYPDLHSVAFAAYSCAHLACFYLAAVYAQWRIARTEPYHTPFDPPDDEAPPFLVAAATGTGTRGTAARRKAE